MSKALAVKKDEEEKDLCTMMDAIGDSENKAFAEFRSLFNCQYNKGIPMLMMFQALDDASVKYCGMHDERCESVLHSYIKSVGSGVERAIADEKTLFMRFVNTLNEGKGTAKDFAGKGFDVNFFKQLHELSKKQIDESEIEGLEITSEGYRVNPLGKATARSKFDDAASFMEKLLGSEKFLTETNLLSHLSTTHKLTPTATKVINTISPCKTVNQIKLLIQKNNVVPEILQGALVFRALGDNGKLVRLGEGPAGIYHVPKSTPLGRIIADMPADVKKNFVSSEDGADIEIPFGKVSVFVTSIFTPDKENDKPVRTIIDRDVALNFTALAVAFRYESALKSTIRSKTNAANKA